MPRAAADQVRRRHVDGYGSMHAKICRLFLSSFSANSHALLQLRLMLTHADCGILFLYYLTDADFL